MPNHTLPVEVRCRKCRYRLVGLPKRICPECGAGFDPSDPSTYRTNLVRPRWREWAHPPAQALCWTALIATVVYLVGASNPAGVVGVVYVSPGPIFPMLLAVLVCVLIPIVILVEFAIRVILCTVNGHFPRDDSDTEVAAPSASFRWLIAPICAAIVASTCWINWPLEARFTASRAAFERAAADLLAVTAAPVDPDTYRGDRVRCKSTIGWFYVDSMNVDVLRREVQFKVGETYDGWWGFRFQADSHPALSATSVTDFWPHDFVFE